MGITAAVTRVAANTSTGIQSITTTDLGGLTPKAVILIATRGVTDGTAADGAGWYMGVSDGTNEVAQGYESQHAQASMNSDNRRDSTANRILTIYDGTAAGTVDGTANFSSFVSDGVEIDWTDAPSAGWLITAIFFAGTDLSAKVGVKLNGGVADALLTESGVGFEADLLFTFVTKSVTTGGPCLGFVHNNRAGTVTQRSAVHKQRDAFSSSSVASMMRDGEAWVQLQSTDTLDWWGRAENFGSAGFDIQLGNARSPNGDLAWLALRLGASPAVSAGVYTFSTPTATGNAADNGLGSEPQFVMYVPNRAAVADTIEGDADGGTFGVVAADADEVYTQSISDEDAAADSNNQSLSDDKLNLPTHTGASGHEATLTSMGSGGVTWNWTAVDATARLWPALAIGINAVGGAATYPGWDGAGVW